MICSLSKIRFGRGGKIEREEEEIMASFERKNLRWNFGHTRLSQLKLSIVVAREGRDVSFR